VGLVPFSADKRKDLPKDTVQSLIDRLVLDIGAEVLVLHHQPTTFLRAHSIHELNFRWLGALVNELDLLISVDTGTLHLGAMLKRPVLAIYGSEDGRVFTKYYPTVRLIQPFTRLCQPCWYSAPCLDGEPKNSRPGDCMMDLTADQLAQEATLMLQDSGRW
jgi:ADP-heptose:LPS heptosyltransferase